jgi:predicted Zn-dependent protease
VVSAEDVMAAFDHDLAVNGIPDDVRLFGRNLVTLNSMGLEDFAFAKLTSLAPELHHAAWYWEAARLMCFGEPAMSAQHRDALEREAEGLRDDAVTADFRAHVHDGTGDIDGALRILQAIPASSLSDSEATLLLKIELARGQPEALALARRTDCFDLRNGQHWQYLAQAEQQAGNLAAASAAWRRAVFYFPDDVALVNEANDFAATQRDDSLAKAIATRFDFDRSLGGYFP